MKGAIFDPAQQRTRRVAWCREHHLARDVSCAIKDAFLLEDAVTNVAVSGDIAIMPFNGDVGSAFDDLGAQVVPKAAEDGEDDS